MSVTEMSEEFIVCRDKVDLIDKLKGKIERLFGTRINFKEICSDGDKQKRWIEVNGGKWDRQNAKTYIVGLCDPQETKTVRCTSDILDDIIEDIERNTQAVICRPSPEEVTISGSELSVTLALSTLEELTKSSFETLTDDQTLGDRNRTASHRLDESLKQAFGEDSGTMQNYPDSIKRVLLEYGDIDDAREVEDFLHGSGSQAPVERSRKTSSEIIVRAKEESDSRRNVTVPICHINAQEHRVLTREQVVTDSAQEKPLDDVFTDQFTEAAQISPRSKQLGMNGHGSGPVALKRFAKKVGYTNDEIEEGLLYIKPPMMPKDFLEVLKQVKEGKEKLGLGNNVGDNQRENARDDEVAAIDSDEDSDLIIVADHFSNKPGGGELTVQDKTLNEHRQEEMAKEFDRQNGRRGQRKKKLPTNPTGTKRKSDPESDPEQTSVLKLWEPIQPLSERVTANVPRRQQLVPPLPAKQQNFRPIMDVPVARPTVAIHQDFPRVPFIQPSDNYGIETTRDAPVHRADLRYVIIDGSNVAMGHGNNKVFSCRGIQIAVDYFLQRGHKVTVFVPEWRKYRNNTMNRIRDQEILDKLESDEHLVFTPSRKVQGKLIASYDDRYILGLAEKEDSVILSNDQYRDLMREKASWKKIIEQRLLMYRFVADHFMPAEDPLGRNGPMLDEFLRKSQPQVPPSRPPRFQETVPRTFIQGQPPQGQRPWNGPLFQGSFNQGQGQVEILNRQQQVPAKRHDDVTRQLYAQLRLVFPESEQDEKVKRILDRHQGETDLNRLTNYCMEIMF